MRKTSSAKTDGFLETLDALPKREQERAFLRLLQSPKLEPELEDLIDQGIAEARRKEKGGRPLREVLAEMDSPRGRKADK